MFCPYCGKPMEQGRFCPHCGKNLLEASPGLIEKEGVPAGAAVAPPPRALTADELLSPKAPAREQAAGSAPVSAPPPVGETEVLRPEMNFAPAGETEVLHYPAGETDPALSRQAPAKAGKRQVLRPEMSYGGSRQPFPAYQPAAQPASGQPGYGAAPRYQPVTQPAPAAGTLPEKSSPLKALALVFGWLSFGLYVIVMCIFMVSHMVRILPYATVDSFLGGLLLPLALLLGMAVALASCVAVGKSRAMTLVGMLFSAALLGLMTWYSYTVNWPVLVLMGAAGGILAVVAGLLGVFVKPRKRGVGVLVVIVVFAVLCLLCLAIWVLTGGADWLLARTALLM